MTTDHYAGVAPGWDAHAGRVYGPIAAFRAGVVVDDVVAAFVLNHLDEPVAALRDLARVTRPTVMEPYRPRVVRLVATVA